MTLDIPASWQALAEQLAGTGWRRLIVLGATDRGKSTFCRFLCRHLSAHGLPVSLLDTDLGQKMIGPPACVTLGRWESGDLLDPAGMVFVGETNPAATMTALIAASARLAGRIRTERLIVNTSGLVTGPGIPLKRWKIEALDPDHVVAIVRGDELAPILAPLAPARLHILEPSPAIRRKSAAVRERSRRNGLLSALHSARPAFLGEAMVEELQRVTPDPDLFRLCGLAGPDGEDCGIGLLRGMDFAERRQLWTTLEPEQVRRVRLGMAVPANLAKAIGHPSTDAGGTAAP